MNIKQDKLLKIIKYLNFENILLYISLTFVLMTYIYYLINAKWLLNSDIATEILNGQEMYKRMTIFLSQFYFSTEIFIIRTPFFIALFLFFTDNIFNAFLLAVISEIILQIICFIYMGKRFSLNTKSIFWGILVFWGIRSYVTGNICGMGSSSYATIYMLTFLVIGYYISCIRNNRNFTDKIIYYIIIIMSFIFGLSSFRMMAILFVPIFITHVANKIWSKEIIVCKGDNITQEIIVWCIANLIGIIITSKIIMPLGFGPVDYRTDKTPGLLYIVTESIPQFLTEFFHKTPIFGIMMDTNLLSISGIVGILCLFFFLLIIFLHKKTSNTIEKYRLISYNIIITSLFLVLISQILFYNKNLLQIRYYMYIFLFFSLVIMFSFEEVLNKNKILKTFTTLLLSIFLITNNIYNINKIPELKKTNVSRISLWHADEISAILKSYDVSLGYSLFWDSNCITVLTNGQTEIAAVNGNMTPLKYVTPFRYYDNAISEQKTAFIKITQPVYEEYQNFPQFYISNNAILELAIAKEFIKGSFYDIEIFIFEKNYFTFPPDYDPRSAFLS
jgi:hypothetical protein